MVLLMVLGLALAYVLAAAWRLGLYQRLPLAFSEISLEEIPDRAAAAYGNRNLFSSDTPCAWDVPRTFTNETGSREWSAERIRSTIGLLAAMLRDLAVGRGDRVAILKGNHFDIHLFTAAIVRCGGIACPLNGRFAASHVQPYLTRLGATLLITDELTLRRILREGGALGCVARVVLAEKRAASGVSSDQSLTQQLASGHPHVELIWLEEQLANVGEGLPAVRRSEKEILYLVHSSGTTGVPKPVPLRQGAQSHAIRGWLCYVHISRSRDKGYLAVPNNHQAVILTFNSLLLLGVPVHWTGPYDRVGFEPSRVLHELAAGGFTSFFGFPITYTQITNLPLERYDLRRMRFWASTADASHEAVQRRLVLVGGFFRSLGIPLKGSIYLDAQGSSEVGTPSVLRYVSRLTRRFNRRVGRPGSVPFGPEVRVIDENGVPARSGKVGRLEVRGRTVFEGYWNDSETTRRAFRDGWFFTGDVARRSADGNIVQLDREVDVIHTSKGDVYSLPIEEKIHKHSAVFDTCVYGERQEDGSQQPVAAIALRDGFPISRERLLLEINGMLDEGECLHRLDILPWSEFPIGVTGKTLKRVFRERTERGEWPSVQTGTA